MTRYQVDSEAVLTTTAAARGAVDRIQSEVTGLHSQLTSLQDSWSGPAAIAFQGVVTEWHGLEQQMNEGLENLGRALTVAGQQYADTEAANARLFAH